MSVGQDTEGNGAAADQELPIGKRLAAARKARALEVRAVADELHLDPAIIEALENNDAAALPAAIFVKGYLRSYARLVGLPEDELAQAYDRQTGEPPPLSVVSLQDKAPIIQLPSARLLRNIILLLLAAILLWLAYPFVERLIESRGGMTTDEPLPGRLQLPPASSQEDSMNGRDLRPDTHRYV